MPELRIGYIGIGLMGTPMAVRLRDAGFPVTVWGQDRAQARPGDRGRGPSGSAHRPRWPGPATW